MRCFVVFFAVLCALAYAIRDQSVVMVTNATEFQAALDNADADDIITLAPGDYSLPSASDAFVLKNSGVRGSLITITCENIGEAVIHNTLNFDGASFVHVYNVTIATKKGAGVRAVNGEAIFFDDISVSAESDNGLYLWGLDGTSVDHCHFSNIGKEAVVIGSSKYVHVDYCTFGDGIHSVAVDFNYAITGFDAAYNRFCGNGYTGSSPSWAAVGSDCESGTFRNNIFYNPDGHKMGAGVQINGGKGNKFVDNVMVLSSGYGFKVAGVQKICRNNVVVGGGLLTNAELEDDDNC